MSIIFDNNKEIIDSITPVEAFESTSEGNIYKLTKAINDLDLAICCTKSKKLIQLNRDLLNQLREYSPTVEYIETLKEKFASDNYVENILFEILAYDNNSIQNMAASARKRFNSQITDDLYRCSPAFENIACYHEPEKIIVLWFLPSPIKLNNSTDGSIIETNVKTYLEKNLNISVENVSVSVVSDPLSHETEYFIKHVVVPDSMVKILGITTPESSYSITQRKRHS